MTAKMAKVWIVVLHSANKKCDISFEDKATAEISLMILIIIWFLLTTVSVTVTWSMVKKPVSQMKWFCQKHFIYEMSHPKTIPECSLCALRKVHFDENYILEWHWKKKKHKKRFGWKYSKQWAFWEQTCQRMITTESLISPAHTTGHFKHIHDRCSRNSKNVSDNVSCSIW